MANADTGLTVRFEQAGKEEQRVKDWSIDSSYLVSTDEFHFTLYSPKREDFQDIELQPVELIVNGASQCLGRIEVTERGSDGSAVACSGRDYISEIVECNVDPFKVVTANTALGDALLDMMRPVGIKTVTDFDGLNMTQVRSGIAPKGGKKRKSPKAVKAEDYKPTPGQGIYEFCNRLIARHGATLQPANKRSEILIDAPDFDQDPLFFLTRTDDTTSSAGNNIESATARRDFTRFPTYAVFTGTVAKSNETGTGVGFQFDMLKFAESLGNDELIRIMARAVQPGRSKEGDPNALYRLLYHRDTDSRTQAQLEAAAHRAVAERLKDTLSYSATVRGHVDPISGAVWSVGAMCSVNDAITGVHENLWILSRKLRYGTDGAMTDLEMIRPGTLFLGEP